jgi:hypothetical protein
MKQILKHALRIMIIGMVIVYAVTGTAHAMRTSNITISQQGKKIQLDGFLLEWKSENAHTFAGDGRLLWDAVNTTEGLAGYVKMVMTDSCRPVALVICADTASCADISLRKDSMQTAGAVMYAAAGDSLSKTVEFIVPWNEHGPDTIQVMLTAVSECGDTIGKVACKTKTIIQRKTTIMTATLKFQLVFIAVLIIAYLVLMSRIRKMKITRRKEWPRQ